MDNGISLEVMVHLGYPGVCEDVEVKEGITNSLIMKNLLLSICSRNFYDP